MLKLFAQSAGAFYAVALAPRLVCTRNHKEKAPAESWGAWKLPNYRRGMKFGAGFVPYRA
jgi:hypothetical protein